MIKLWNLYKQTLKLNIIREETLNSQNTQKKITFEIHGELWEMPQFFSFFFFFC
jgi:hypothetical protein